MIYALIACSALVFLLTLVTLYLLREVYLLHGAVYQIEVRLADFTRSVLSGQTDVLATFRGLVDRKAPLEAHVILFGPNFLCGKTVKILPGSEQMIDFGARMELPKDTYITVLGPCRLKQVWLGQLVLDKFETPGANLIVKTPSAMPLGQILTVVVEPWS